MAAHTLGFLDAQDPLPFEDLFLPLVSQAREQLRERVHPESHCSLSPEAHSRWERYLLTRLTNAGAHAAQWQFEVFKTVQMAFPGNRRKTHLHSAAQYRGFVGEKEGARLHQLFDEFPVLRKLCSVLQANWVAASAEFLQRLQDDQTEFSSHFAGNAFILPATKLDVGIGDPHRGGRCVVRLHFKNGRSLIYKPRSLAPEAHFSVLLGACDALDIPHRLRAPRCWDRGEYGWMENIEAMSCQSRAQIRAFYWRAGALVGLIYLARGVDCHRGNLIAAGEFPVLIDLETLWHLQMPDFDAPIVPMDSVLRTGFLPRGQRRLDALYQWSGLSWIEYAKRPTAVWDRINQDNMSVATQIRDSRAHGHLPVLDEKSCLAPEFTEDVTAGFKWVGDNLLGSERARATFARWLGVLVNCPRRLILRPTLVYAVALQRVTAPASMRHDQPIAARLEGIEPGRGLNFNECEMCALAQLDIPYFAQTTTCEKLLKGTSSIPTKDSYLAQIPTIERALRGYASGALA